jgi:hypothetical protein
MGRLRKKQKEAVYAWIAEGLESDEINERAASFRPAFQVSRQQVDWYRKRASVELEDIRKAGRLEALSEGLARKEVRVSRLQQLAALMERDLFGGFLWTENVKSVGSGPEQQIVDFEEFNKAEVDAYRGVLDDIARELGHRKQGVEHSGEVTVNNERERLERRVLDLVESGGTFQVPSESDE